MDGSEGGNGGDRKGREKGEKDNERRVVKEGVKRSKYGETEGDKQVNGKMR